MRRTRSLALAAAALVAAGACARPDTTQPRLAVASDGAARALATRFFDAYVQSDIATALPLLCAPDAAARARDAAFIERSQGEGSPYRVTSYALAGVEPTWVGADPCFTIDVTFPPAALSGAPAAAPPATAPREQPAEPRVHRYTLRAREGCIELFSPTEQKADEAQQAPARPTDPGGEAPIEL